MITMSKTDELAKIIGISSNIVFFGGAGMSTESGIPDFRSVDGIYNQKLNKRFSPEEMVSHTFLMSHPEEFFEFLFNKMIFWEATPNKGHQALAELESRGKLQAVVTQNIDGLHQKAGSEEVYELHGTVMRWYCMDCGSSYSLLCKKMARGEFHGVRIAVVLCARMSCSMKKHLMNWCLKML